MLGAGAWGPEPRARRTVTPVIVRVARPCRDRGPESGEPDTSELAELLQDLQKGPLTRTIKQCITDLQRVVAVLTLDTPAVPVKTGRAAAGVHC